MNLYPTLSKLYPEGTRQGQCFDFCHKLVNFPGVGTLLGAKIKALNTFGIPMAKLDSIKVGDIILETYPVFGHGAFVNAIIGDKLQLTESNFNLDQKVHHTRLISAHDPKILGVFRGSALYPIPKVQYPIQIKVMIIMNNQPFWNSLLQHMANLQSWFWNASGQRIELIIDYKNTNLGKPDTIFTGPIIGGNNVEIIKEDWMNTQVVPQAIGNNIIIYNMPRADWHGTVFDHPELMECGYTYENKVLPIKIFTVADEHDDYPPYYYNLGAYAKLMAHEICHGLYGLCAGSNVVPGGDYTHNHFLRDFKPEDCFNDYDFEKLNEIINP